MFEYGNNKKVYPSPSKGALFAGVIAVETVFTLLGALLFNSLYSAATQLGFSQLVFIVMATVLVIPLTVLQ